MGVLVPLLRAGSCLARGRLLQPLCRPAAANLAGAGVTPKPAWPLRRALSSTPPSSVGVAPSPLDLLRDYYEKNKPTIKLPEPFLPDKVYERDLPLASVASAFDTAFEAYKDGSDERGTPCRSAGRVWRREDDVQAACAARHRQAR